jgi:rRNA maturation endonuclease Nob1
MQRNYNCDSCDAEFKVKHSLDETYYEVNFCPFCGGQIEEDDDNETEDFE